MARGFERQVAEIQVRIAVLNRYTDFGIAITETVCEVSPCMRNNAHSNAKSTNIFFELR
jgi:hypothetical protein